MRSLFHRAARRAPAAAVAALGVCLVLAAPARTASAQGVSITPNDPRVSYGWTLTPTFVFTQATDDNVTLAGKDAQATGDSVASLSPSVELGYRSPRTALTGGYAGSAVRYFTLDQLDTFDQRLYVDLKTLVTRRVQVFSTASANWLPTTDTVLLAGVPFLRVGSQIKSLQAGVALAVAKHTTVSTGYRLEYIDFDRSNPLAARLLGGHSNGVYGDVRQQVSPNLTIGAAYDIRRALIAGGLQQFDMQDVRGTVEYRFSPLLFVSGGFGVARIAGTLPGDPSRTGPSWNASVNYRVSERTLAYASYQRSYVPSFGIGGTVQNEEFSVGARAPVALRDRLVVTGNASWRRNDPLLLTIASRSLSSFWVSGNLGYAFAPWLRVEGFYARSSQDSHLAGGIVQRQQIGVQVVTLAPMRFK